MLPHFSITWTIAADIVCPIISSVILDQHGTSITIWVLGLSAVGAAGLLLRATLLVLGRVGLAEALFLRMSGLNSDALRWPDLSLEKWLALGPKRMSPTAAVQAVRHENRAVSFGEPKRT